MGDQLKRDSYSHWMLNTALSYLCAQEHISHFNLGSDMHFI